MYDFSGPFNKLFSDQVHPSELGHIIIAYAFLDKIINNLLL